MVSAGFCLVPVSPPLLKSPDWFCHMNLRSSPGFCILETSAVLARFEEPSKKLLRAGWDVGWEATVRGARICTHPWVRGHPSLQTPPLVQMREMGMEVGRCSDKLVTRRQRGPWPQNSTKENHYVERLFYFLIMTNGRDGFLRCIYF